MRHIIIGTAGHVDHGKTALIKALTQIDCDTHKEEKDRGITINLGFAHLKLPSGEAMGIVDMPGHKDFIKTMVAGSFGVDIVLLVIAADSGIMPQTIEHFKILELLGVENGIIVITKKDIVDSETLELAEMEIEEFLEGTLLENSPIVKVSSINGEGLDELITQLTSILPKVKEKPKSSLFRMYIDRVFNVKGVGFIVTGSVLGGRLKVGENLNLLPSKGKQYKVRSIQRHGETVEEVESGDRAAINITGFKKEDFERGMVLTDKLIDETIMIDATFTIFDKDLELGLWTNTIIYSASFECAARVHLLNGETYLQDKIAIVQIHLSKPTILLNNDKYILRNSSNNMTIGGGIVIDNKPLHHRRRTTKLLKSLKDLVDATLNSDNIFSLVKIELRKYNSVVSIDQLVNDLDLSQKEILDECDSKNDGSIIIYDNNILIHSDIQNENRDSIIRILGDYHKLNYLIEEGISTNEFYGKLGFKSKEIGKQYLQYLFQLMSNSGLIKEVNSSWVLASHSVHFDENTLALLDKLEAGIQDFGHQTATLKDIEAFASKNNIKKEILRMLMNILLSNKTILSSEGEYVHAEVLDEVRKQILLILLHKEQGINEKEFRVEVGCTKTFVKTIIRLLVEEGIVTKAEFYIHITDKGRAAANLA